MSVFHGPVQTLPGTNILIVCYSTTTNFIHSEKLIEESKYFPNKAHKSCLVTVTRAIITL